MSDVKRYKMDLGHIPSAVALSFLPPVMVSAEDYDRLAAENERLKSELDTMQAAAKALRDEWRKDQTELEALRQQAGVNWQSFGDWLEWELDEGGGTKAQVSDAEKRLAKRVWHCLAARKHVRGTNVVDMQEEQEPVNYKRKFECLVGHAKRQDAEIAKLRYDESVRRFYDDGSVWLWAGDETDNLETLSCPVVINAGDLRALIAGAQKQSVSGLVEALENLIENAKDAMIYANRDGSGYDIYEELAEAKDALAAHRAKGVQ